jgi:predicted DNA-binding transcriptional regulator AlpA
MEYEFLFVVEGITLDDDHAVGVIVDTFDGLLSWHCGVHRLAVSVDGADAMDALLTLLRQLSDKVPALRVLRLDPDLVGVRDIAERTGRSRQNVQQWVSGDRNAGHPFPPPEGAAGRSLVWRWAEVNAWLAPLGLADQATRPTREESLRIDHALSHPQGTVALPALA